MDCVDPNGPAVGECEIVGDDSHTIVAHCSRPQWNWKTSLVREFLTPYAADAVVLEIAPGSCSEFLVEVARHVVLVDINEDCLRTYHERFSHLNHIEYLLGDGVSLPVADESIDFVWSFDAFVHMAPAVVRSYVCEIGRVLRPGGHAVIHHANKHVCSRVFQRITGQGRLRCDGNRSNITGKMVAEWAAAEGMTVMQTDSWGPKRQYDVRKYRDLISVFERSRPHEAVK